MPTQSGNAHNFDIVSFLIVDDDAVAVMSIERAIKKLKLANPVHVAKDGQRGLDILRGQNGHKKLEPPLVVLLDLAMPGMSGLEFLEELRNDPVLKNTTVFVLTSSDNPHTIAKAYERNIAGYIVKESAYDTFRKTLEMIDNFSNVVVLPK